MGEERGDTGLRGEYGNEDENGLRVGEAHPHLVLLEGLILDAHLISGNALDGDETFTVAQKPGVGGRVGEEEPDDDGPEAS